VGAHRREELPPARWRVRLRVHEWQDHVGTLHLRRRRRCQGRLASRHGGPYCGGGASDTAGNPVRRCTTCQPTLSMKKSPSAAVLLSTTTAKSFSGLKAAKALYPWEPLGSRRRSEAAPAVPLRSQAARGDDALAVHRLFRERRAAGSARQQIRDLPSAGRGAPGGSRLVVGATGAGHKGPERDDPHSRAFLGLVPDRFNVIEAGDGGYLPAGVPGGRDPDSESSTARTFLRSASGVIGF
jgi:hypothetical protein